MSSSRTYFALRKQEGWPAASPPNHAAGPYLNHARYDVENRLAEATHSSMGTDRYGYDAANRRVWKRQEGSFNQEFTYFYGVDGQLLGTYGGGYGGLGFGTGSTNVWFGGKLIWAEGKSAVTDRLGSVVNFGKKYYPYGEEPATTQQNHTKFATYYRDETTALDYAVNRYYGRTIGRFLTPDPYQASGGPADPGSWNRYAYTRGDPVNRTDASGLQDEGPDDIVDCGPYGMIPENACRFFLQATAQPETSSESSGKRQDLDERQLRRTVRNLYAGISAARNALTGDCFAFLAGGTSINPRQVLDDIFNGKLGYFAISDIQDREGYVTSAITRIETSRFVDIGNGAQQLQAATVAIRINGSAGNFVNGTLSERRTTILHELAHAIWDLYGPTTGNGMLSANYGIQPDFDSNASVAATKSEANHDAIREHCR